MHRIAIGLLLAAVIALLARRVRALAPSGAVAATVVGAICVAAGWEWATVLLAFFATSTALSRLRAERKAALLGALVAKGGERDAVQVLANGGPFALAALGMLVQPSPTWLVAGAAAIAAATADTWATEIGTLAARRPRTILGWREVPAGTSGAVSALGLLAALAGSGFIAAAVLLLGWPSAAALGALVGGIAGSTVDSLLGAGLQARRWCDACDRPTERTEHDCGAPTRVIGGLRWLDNDGVNLVSGLMGATIGWLAVRGVSW
jgi:uncharacterized protein (TIGR00297 family)